MEASPPPAKKLRTMHMTECVREFKLPRQFPSMVKPQEKGIVLKLKNGRKVANLTMNVANVTVPKAVKLLPNKDVQSGSTLQKLRIKLPNGKDLGEFNVQLLPWKNDILASKTIFSKHNTSENLNKSVTLSIINTHENIEKTVCMSQTFDKKNTNVKNHDTCTKSTSLHVYQPSEFNEDDMENRRNVMRNKPIILTRKGVPIGKRYCENIEDKIDGKGKNSNIIPALVENRNDEELKTVGGMENGVSRFTKIPQNLQTTRLLLLDQNSAQRNAKMETKKLSNRKFDVTGLKDTNLTSNLKLPQYQKAGDAKFSVAQCEQPVLQDTETRKIFGTSIKSAIESTSPLMLSQKESNEASLYSLYRKSTTVAKNDVHPTRIKTTTDVVVRSNGRKTFSDTSQNKRGLGENVMVVLHDNRANWLIRSSNVNNQDSSQNNPNSQSGENHVWETLDSSWGLNDKDGSRSLKNLNSETNNIQAEGKLPFGKGDSNYTDKKLSQEHLNGTRDILEKALNSVKDEKLRADALKALAACGIITERHAPLPAASDKKVVHDTQVQTSVFSLLEPDSFILVSENDPDITRVMQKDHISSNILINSPQNMLNNAATAEDIQDDYIEGFDLRLMADDVLKGSEGATQVKDILTKPSQRCNNIVLQLKRDFENALEYDEDGLLNIHKAVIDNRICDVQRQLMVLKGRKVNIDIKTQDGRTSLELALAFNVSSEIILSLLNAGAQPVSQEPTHESAILIASKTRSSLLTDLVRHVSDSNLLDVLDSTGFAAVHYCAQFGDLEGITALIRAGANVNLKDGRSGRTALFHAIEHKRIIVAQRLLDNGALVHIPNFSGQTVSSLVDEIKSLSFRTSLNRAVK